MASRPVTRVAAMALLVALVLVGPTRAAAQQLELCDVPWLDADHVRAILQIELGDRWSAAIDQTTVRLATCEGDAPHLELSSPASQPTMLTVRLSGVAPRARTRLLALVIAELLRTRIEPPPDDSVAVAAAIDSQPVTPSEAMPSETMSSEATPSASDLAATPPQDESDAAPPLHATASSIGARWRAPTAPAVALAAPSPTSQRELDAAHASTPAPWRLGLTVSARTYLLPLTLAGLVDVQLRYDRLLIAIGGGGAQGEGSSGIVRLGQATAGIGVRVAEHRRGVRVGWDLRADAGVAIAAGEPAQPFVVARTHVTYLLAGSTEVEVVWAIDSFEIGFTTAVGYQRGIIERSDPHVGLGGMFASLGAAVAWQL